MKFEISEFDKNALVLIRESVSKLIKESSEEFDKVYYNILDIAPQDHLGCKEFYKLAIIETLDLDVNSNATYIADLCNSNISIIPDNRFDVVVCTEVLEHVRNPFDAVNEIYRITKPGGSIYISTPFNFRIHGPLPDNWRFTIHGLKELFSKFTILKIEEVNSNRDLSPIHYRLIAKKI